MNTQDALNICQQARTQQKRISEYPIDLVYRLIDAVGKRWSDPDYSYRKTAKEKLPKLTGFTPEMIELGLAEIPSLFDSKLLKIKFATEGRGIPRSRGFKFDSDNSTCLQWQPLGSVLHILSGNVFLVGPGSLIEGLLTGNVTILKLSSAETFFMPLFMRSLQEIEKEVGVEPVVSESVFIVEFSSSQKDVIDAFKKQVDGIVLWGGEDAVRAYRNDLPARTRLIVFGPKLSVALVMNDVETQNNINKLAGKLKDELTIWDQNACTAPQICFVQSEDLARKLLLATDIMFQESFFRSTHESTPGTCYPNQAAEIRKIRGVQEIAEARGEGLLRDDRDFGNKMAWTLYLDTSKTIEVSPLHRTIKFVPFENLDEVYTMIEDMRAYVQTVGLACEENSFFHTSAKLASMGVLRVFDLGMMSSGAIDDPHDGSYDLPQLMNLVVTRRDRKISTYRSFDLMSTQDRKVEIDARIRILTNYRAMNAEELHKIPISEKNDLKKKARSFYLRPELIDGGYLTRSGGTTGEGSFSYLDKADWESMLTSAVEVFRACGFVKNDRIANFMSAIDLYGSFITFNDVNQKLGAMSFCFGSCLDLERNLEVMQNYAVNVAQGIPSSMMPILRKMKELHPSLILEKVMYAGLPISEVDKLWLKEKLGVRIISSVIGTTESNQLAYQCPYLSANHHHLIEDYNFVEIVDENNEPVEAGEVGSLIVTNLQKFKLPVIRYRIGDQARLLSESDCLCGTKSRTIDYLGRNDAILCIGMMNVDYGDVAKSLDDMQISALQLVARATTTGEVLSVRVESAQNEEELENKVRTRIYERVREFQEFEQKNLFSLDIEVLPYGAIARNPRTGKIKPIIDERYIQ